MHWIRAPRTGPPWLTGFRSDKEYEAYADQQERQRRRREDREKWGFADGLPTKEELAEAKLRAQRRRICGVEGHDWQLVKVTEDGYLVQQCYRCDNLRFLAQSGSTRTPDEARRYPRNRV